MVTRLFIFHTSAYIVNMALQPEILSSVLKKENMQRACSNKRRVIQDGSLGEGKEAFVYSFIVRLFVSAIENFYVLSFSFVKHMVSHLMNVEVSR